jgi:predicted MFS family arabinose efflux permease
MGMYSVFLGVGQFIGAIAGGPFVDWRGADGIVVVTALFGLVSLITLWRLHRSEARLAVVA